VVVTGGLVSGDEKSVLRALRKWWIQWRHAESAWLDVKVKLLALEPFVTARLAHLRARVLDGDTARTVGPYLPDMGSSAPIQVRLTE